MSHREAAITGAGEAIRKHLAGAGLDGEFLFEIVRFHPQPGAGRLALAKPGVLAQLPCCGWTAASGEHESQTY